jgi:transposase-like protein
MQELMTYAGQLECYSRCEEILERFTTVKVSPSQIYRVTDYVSESLKEEDGKAERTLTPLSREDILYVEIDGSMICTRNKESWKEIKLGRLFKGSDCLNPNSESSYLSESQYVGHFGSSVDFGEKLCRVIDSYGDLKTRLVFVTDGAAWIREWIADHYPVSISILDFFHVMEHLYAFADKAFSASSEKRQWCDRQKELLLASDVEAVLENIVSTDAKEEDKQKLITYYRNNKKRMRYKQYRNVGCGIIGSGAIESAHRTVIQKRMKLSGQRWSTKGVENMLRLRVINMNKQWSKIIEFVKRAPLAQAA